MLNRSRLKKEFAHAQMADGSLLISYRLFVLWSNYPFGQDVDAIYIEVQLFDFGH